jgi:L-histidine Nalpha-methyltransferase
MQVSPISLSTNSAEHGNLAGTNDSEFVWHTRALPDQVPHPLVARRFSDEVLLGLCQENKSISSVWGYDAAGLVLADAVAASPEHYLSRAEANILRANRPLLRELLCRSNGVVEITNGRCATSSLLLSAMDRPACYAAVNISPEVLERSANIIRSSFPEIVCRSQLADIRQPMSLSDPTDDYASLVAYFPGSSIASMMPLESVMCMQRIRQLLGQEGLLVVAQDTSRTPDVVLPAYDDASGACAAFNRNILTRINRELGGSFDPASFRHEARFNHRLGRVETHLVSGVSQWVEVSDRAIHFEMGESIHTGNAYKYAVDDFLALAQSAGWNNLHTWTDRDSCFAVHVLSANRQCTSL